MYAIYTSSKPAIFLVLLGTKPIHLITPYFGAATLLRTSTSEPMSSSSDPNVLTWLAPMSAASKEINK